MYHRFISALVLVAALMNSVLGGSRVAHAVPHNPNEVPASQSYAGSRTFSETGFTISNYFYKTWTSTPNALFVYGMPISQPFIEESFTTPGEFYRVQYFERAILEEHPDSAGTPYYILGRLLGSRLVASRGGETPFKAVADPGDGTYDKVTRHTLRNSPAPFRTFYSKNGGISVFGRPLSEQFQEVNKANGKTYWVQYFERNRMEWHPEETNPKYQILLGLLGNEYRDANHAGNPAFTAGATIPGSSGGTAPTATAAPITAPVSGFVYGFNAILYSQGGAVDRPRTLQLAKDAGMPWIRQQVRWMDLHDRSGVIHWGELDNIVSDASNMGVKLLIQVVAAPSWATSNGKNGMPDRAHFNDFNYFMGEMAKRYKGRIQAYEIWNEQNLAHENGGRVANASFYMDMLVGASNAIRAGDPSALVVSGAPSSTETNVSTVAISDITFLEQMFSDPRFNGAVDIVGVHPGGHSNPPDTFWPDKPGPGPNFVKSREFYFRRVEDVRALMVRKGLSDKKVWVTEFGWATKNNTPGYEFGNYISYQQQSDYIIRAIQLARTNYSPWLTGMFLWQLNFAVTWKASGNELHEQAAFGVINGDYSPRPAYLALQAMQK